MGMYGFHVMVDARLGMCMRHIKSFIIYVCSPYKTAHNARFVCKNLLNSHIKNSLISYIEPSTSISIKNILMVRGHIYVHIVSENEL